MAETKRPYRSKTKRQLTGRIRLTARDRAIIRAVYEYRFLTLPQLQALIFHSLKNELPGLGKRTTKSDAPDLSWPQRVLARLFHAGYLNRVFLPILNSPAIYTLDTLGIELLKREYGIARPQFGWKAWRPSAKTLQGGFFQHALAINTFRILFTRACEAAGYSLAQVLTESELRARTDSIQVDESWGWGSMTAIPVVPDSYFLVQTPRGSAHFFLELDRATMELPRFQTKIRGYIAYHQVGGFRTRYKASKFRVLTVIAAETPVESEKRALKLKAAIEQIGGRSLFWFAPLHALTPHNLLHERLWLIAGEQEPALLFNP